MGDGRECLSGFTAGEGGKISSWRESGPLPCPSLHELESRILRNQIKAEDNEDTLAGVPLRSVAGLLWKWIVKL